MKHLFAVLGWAIVFALLGAGLMLGFGTICYHHLPHAHGAFAAAGIGAECGLNFLILALCFAALPGARPTGPKVYGTLQGLWGILGFGIVMLTGGLLMANVLVVENFALAARHAPLVNFGDTTFLISAAVAGELAAAIWVSWYMRRLGPAHLHDATARGIAWLPAPREAYAAAILCAGGLIVIMSLFFHFIPPDMTTLETLPMAKMFTGPAIAVAPMLGVALLLGPVLEELVFRGIAFGGLASRLGPLGAGAVTTFLFVAAHAPEKLHYLPGFVDVGLLAVAAVWLRLRFGSIRPGILLHIVYNTGGLFAASMFQ